jgi:ribosomal protein L37AE/L43A
VKGSVSASNSHFMICPLCEVAELRLDGNASARCDSCLRVLEGAVLETLEQVVGLPDALGKHACECGHPEMRRLPDGVFHCPACGAEIIPLEASSTQIRPFRVGNR